MSGPNAWSWIDFPATRHNNGCVLSFADGHAEAWKWREGRTIQSGKLKGWIQGVSGVAGTDRDLGRLYDAGRGETRLVISLAKVETVRRRACQAFLPR